VLIGTGVYKDDIRYALLRQTGLLAVLAIAIIGGVLLVSRRIAASVATPIEDLTRRMAGLAGGDTQSPVPNLDRQDEIGGMSQALEVFRQAAIAQKTAEHDLHTAIDTVGQHLHALANGNLGARMHYIPPAYSVLLDHYNRAVEGSTRRWAWCTATPPPLPRPLPASAMARSIWPSAPNRKLPHWNAPRAIWPM
jgi:methyl-accepting chemotaxis protein